MNPLNIINIKKTWTAFLSAILLSTLAACSGGHDESDTEVDSGVVGDNAQLSVVLTDSNGNTSNSITSGDGLTVTATLVDTGGAAIADQRVEFAASSGSLNSNSRLTDSNGQAQVSFDSSAITSGVVTITTTATVNEESLTFSSEFEVLESAIVEEEEPTLSLLLKQNGENIWQLKENDEAQLSAELLDGDDQPISGAEVIFTSERGVLRQDSALTNENGVAEATITAPQDNLGVSNATAQVSLNGVTFTEVLKFEVIEQDATAVNLRLGYINGSGDFIDGEIFSETTDSDGDTTINAGASMGVSVAIVDDSGQLYSGPVVVSFTSECATDGLAELSTTATANNGRASATFKDLSCATGGDNSDQIVATITSGSVDVNATLDINITAEPINSIQFVSASPESIVIKGTGGVGNSEESTLTFLVTGANGNPLPNRTVTFELNNTSGGLSLTSNSATTLADGQASVIVSSGTTSTTVRVTASTTEGGQTFFTQSDLLTVSTGIPDQNSITLALETINPEAFNIAGVEVPVTAFLADSFNNPVVDGTQVSFTTEGGSIESGCRTTNGSCTVTWRSQEPFISEDHRVTILATAQGQEYFVDVNGDNVYDDGDGDSMAATLSDSVLNPIFSGFGRLSPQSSGFLDLPSAWRDDNENYQYDSGETVIPQNDGEEGYQAADGEYNGPLCNASNCSNTRSTNIRKAVVLIMASTGSNYRLRNDDTGEVIASNYEAETGSTTSIAKDSFVEFTVDVADTAFQIMPAGTILSVSATVGELRGETSHTFANSVGTTDPDGYGGTTLAFNIANNSAADDPASPGELTITITTPSGSSLIISANIELQ